MNEIEPALDITSLRTAYLSGQYDAGTLIRGLLRHIRANDEHNAWIYLLTDREIDFYLQRLRHADIEQLPLFGIPFAVKDNIDIQEVPTTAACPEVSYPPAETAHVVEKLVAAGAVPLGKTNLDQFATGLVGTRSPYGCCTNAFDPEYIAGGSSSGSALAVALGHVSFALGTDTAGSGRIPAAFNNLIGLKPSCGLVSTHGLFPTCRSLDCVSLFTLNALDAVQVLQIAAGFDPEDPYSKRVTLHRENRKHFVVGIPRFDQLLFFGNREYERLFDQTVAGLEGLGHRVVEVDIEPLLDAEKLLYQGPWLAERAGLLEGILRDCPDAVLPLIRQIIEGGYEKTAIEAFRSQHKIRKYQRMTETLFGQCDALVTPTAGTIFRIEEVEADPIRLNDRLGYYAHFMNLLELCAVSVPAGFQKDGLPFGVTLSAPAGYDYQLLALAGQLQAKCTSYGGCGRPLRVSLEEPLAN